MSEKSLKKVYDILGMPQPKPTLAEAQALQDMLARLKHARENDPLFDQKAMRAWVQAEAAADPDDYDDLNAKDMAKMLNKGIKPKRTIKPPQT